MDRNPKASNIYRLDDYTSKVGLFVCCHCKSYYMTIVTWDDPLRCVGCMSDDTIFIESGFFKDLIIYDSDEDYEN